MTGHTPNSTTNQDFLSTMHTMIDDLDTISSNIDEHTYLRLANGLQRLYNIHIQNSGTSNNQNTANREQEIGLQENNVAQNIIRHFERVNDISGVPINAYPVNADAYPVNADAYPVNADAYPVNADDYPVNSITNYTNANANANANANNNENIQSRIQSLNEETARMNYSTRTRLALYGNVF